MRAQLDTLDRRASAKLRATHLSPVVSVVHRFSQLGSYGVGWVALFGVAVTWLEGWKPAAVASACVIGSLLINTIIKTFIKRDRPAENPIGHKPSTHSMPSAHTVMAVVGATCMCVVAPSAWPLWIAIVLLLGWSRVYLGMHYLGDVLAGLVLGALLALAVARPLMHWAL